MLRECGGQTLEHLLLTLDGVRADGTSQCKVLLASISLRSLYRGEGKHLLLASADAPTVEGDTILDRESLHLCFGGVDVFEVKRQRAGDDQHLVGLRRILFVAGSEHLGTQLL